MIYALFIFANFHPHISVPSCTSHSICKPWRFFEVLTSSFLTSAQQPSSCPHSWCLLLSDLAKLFRAQQSIWLLFQEIVSNTAVNINTITVDHVGGKGGMFKLPYSVQWEPGVIFKSYHFLLLFGQVKSLNFVESHFSLLKREY